jgi:hypothetical protein
MRKPLSHRNRSEPDLVPFLGSGSRRLELWDPNVIKDRHLPQRLSRGLKHLTVALDSLRELDQLHCNLQTCLQDQDTLQYLGVQVRGDELSIIVPSSVLPSWPLALLKGRFKKWEATIKAVTLTCARSLIRPSIGPNSASSTGFH